MKLFISLLLLCLNLNLFSSEDPYEFTGQHLLISYMDCDPQAIRSEQKLTEKMEEACGATGVHILSSTQHQFQSEGFTQVFLLSESHASIHTYPEYKACFIDLFTCGSSFQMDKFEKVMHDFLKPSKVDCMQMKRSESTYETTFKPQR